MAFDRRLFIATAATSVAAGSAPVFAQSAEAPGVTLAKSLYAAFGKGDVATIVNACTSDVDWEVVGRSSDFPSFGARKGQSGVKEFFEAVGAHCTFTEFAPKEFFAVGDKVFVLGQYGLTVKKTSKSFSSAWLHVFTIADRKVKGFMEFTDTAKGAEAYRG